MNTENENAAVDVAPTRSLFAAGATATVADVTATEPEHVEPVAESVEVVEEPVVETTEVEQVQEPVPTEVAPAEPTPVEADDAEKPVEAVQVEHAAEDAAEPVPAEAEKPAEPTPAASPEKSVKELQAEKEALENQITTRQNAEKKKVIAQIAAVVKTFNISVTELAAALGGVPNPRKGVKAPVLFTDGTNEWSGRGRLPKWLVGKNPEDYRIK